jgi:outer membrane protein assembly factor BamB/predicted phosphodiesterase
MRIINFIPVATTVTKRLSTTVILFACALFVWGQTATFRFAVFTDIHISQANPQPAQDLLDAVNDLNSQTGIAFVLVTGDITENGDGKSLREAKKLLDGLKMPYFIIPGNHDTKWTESGATDFKQVFGDDKFRLIFNGFAFLGVNSGPVLRMGDGHIAPQDIQWLERQLKNIGKKTPVFLVTHYPLKTGDVDNWFVVTDLIRKYNTQAVIGGHYHRNMALSYDGIPGIINRSTLRGNAPAGGYTIYDMSDSLYISEKPTGAASIRWHALPIDEKMYTEGDAKNFPRPDYAVNKRYKNVKAVWNKSFGAGIYGSPTVDDSRLFFGDDNGIFRALSLHNGKELWRFQARERIASTAAVSGGRVVFGSCDKNIYCLDAEQGTLLWKITAGAAVLGVPLIAGEVVYIGASDGKFRAVSLKDGSIKWVFDQLKGYVETRPVIADDKIIFGAWDTNLYALNLSDGSLAWQWNNGNSRMHFSPAAVLPAVSDGKVFIAAPDRYLTALDLHNGSIVWRTNQHTVRETVGISLDKKTLYSRCMTDSVVAIEAFGNTPTVRWKTNALFGYDHNPCMPVENSGQIVFATKNGEITALSAVDGAVLWKHKIGNVMINTLTAVSPSDWTLTTSDGTVARITTQ